MQRMGSVTPSPFVWPVEWRVCRRPKLLAGCCQEAKAREVAAGCTGPGAYAIGPLAPCRLCALAAWALALLGDNGTRRVDATRSTGLLLWMPKQLAQR